MKTFTFYATRYLIKETNYVFLNLFHTFSTCLFHLFTRTNFLSYYIGTIHLKKKRTFDIFLIDCYTTILLFTKHFSFHTNINRHHHSLSRWFKLCYFNNNTKIITNRHFYLLPLPLSHNLWHKTTRASDWDSGNR